jgi:hypothetical protein
MMATFWRRAWHANQPPERYKTLLVDRPILRIRPDEELFATSLFLIGDSINWFVEMALMDEPYASGVKLSPACFQRLVSAPFEEQVIGSFREAGFVAGRVSGKGTWSNQNGTVDLSLALGTPPGEVDCLAIHPRGPGFVVECKVLNFPTTPARMQNVLGKLGERDTEGFRHKISAKVRWMSRYIDRTRGPFGMILLDRRLPGMSYLDEIPILDIGILRGLIALVLSKLSS